MANFLQRVGRGFVSAWTAFKESYMLSDPSAASSDFSSQDARQLRYAVYWAFYENSAYRSVHAWAHKYKVDYGLYRYIRTIYNPAYRIGEFWKTHLWGGLLDPQAGDGQIESSALPIVAGEGVNETALRQAIAHVWKWSRWQVNKDITTLQGAVLGDAALRIVDDTTRGLIYVEVVHPSIIEDVELDAWGNVRGYTLEEERDHPEKENKTATYKEEAERAGDAVVYRTYMDGKPYAWNGRAAEWAIPYGFIPLVMIQHNNVGLDWGWSELQPAGSKLREVDDLASKLSDQVRKAVQTPFFAAGMTKPATTQGISSRDSKTYQESSTAADVPDPGREELDIFWGPEGASITPLVFQLDIENTVGYIKSILDECEKDYPELGFERLRLTGTLSGLSLRVARQPAEAKVNQRRALYDDALVRAHQMAIAIGGWRGYDQFRGFGLDSYKAGALEHSIGKRPVFAVDPMDDLEEDKLFWVTAEQAGKAGASLPAFLELQNWDEEQIAIITESEEYKTGQASRRMLLEMANGGEMGGGEEEEESQAEGEE